MFEGKRVAVVYSYETREEAALDANITVVVAEDGGARAKPLAHTRQR